MFQLKVRSYGVISKTGKLSCRQAQAAVPWGQLRGRRVQAGKCKALEVKKQIQHVFRRVTIG